MSLPKDPQRAIEYKQKLTSSLTGRELSQEHRANLRKSYYERNKEKALESQRKYRNGSKRQEYLQKTSNRNRKYYEMNKEERSAYNKQRWQLKVKQLEEAAGRKRPEDCEICGEPGRICFDHDHLTGKFRGWICARCNVVLGKVKDSKDLLNKILKYLD